VASAPRDPPPRGLDPPGIVLAGLSAAPLAFRRVRPAWAYAASTVASLALLDRGYPLDAPVAAAFAGYALALAYSGARPVARASALVAVNAFVPAVAVAYASAGIPPLSIATELLGWAAVFAGLWVAGDRTRLRQLRLAEAAERVRRIQAEAERDRRLAAADERTRIARELHDSAGHAINVILVQAGAARLLQRRDPERARQALETIETVARDTVTDIDRMVRALRDDRDHHEAPADPGALGELIARHRASGLAIAADLPPATAMPRSVAWAAYRILQEALTNAARHGAGSAEVAVRFGGDRVEIDVSNPTVSRPITGGGRPGLGIVGMRDRATLLGGTLRAETADDRFRLSAVLPHA
jgi:signal transduction histidine kinase